MTRTLTKELKEEPTNPFMHSSPLIKNMVSPRDLWNGCNGEIAVIIVVTADVTVAYVRKALEYVLPAISWLLRYCADKSALGVYYALGSIVNNGLTRRISPSVSNLDSKIEKACKVSGEWAGSALVLPLVWASQLAVAAYSVTIAIRAVFLGSALLSLSCIFEILQLTVKTLYKDVFLPAKNSAAGCNNIASKAAHMLLHMPWRPLINAILLMASSLAIHVVFRIVSLACAPFLAPAYTISTIFDLDNRFNIYNYERSMGAVHSYILDMLELMRSGGGPALPVSEHNSIHNACDKGVESATSTDKDSKSVVTVASEVASSELNSVKLEHAAQQPQLHQPTA